MRRILLPALLGALMASAPASAQPLPFPRGRAPDRGPSRQARELVTGWFVHFFNQHPDDNSLSVWSKQVDQTGNPDQVLARMVGESVYYDQVGDTPGGFVHKLFSDLTGREPTRSEFDYWMGRLIRIGGTAPDIEDRTNLAYEMIQRYPPAGAPPGANPNDDYDYRRPAGWRDRP